MNGLKMLGAALLCGFLCYLSFTSVPVMWAHGSSSAFDFAIFLILLTFVTGLGTLVCLAEAFSELSAAIKEVFENDNS